MITESPLTSTKHVEDALVAHKDASMMRVRDGEGRNFRSVTNSGKFRTEIPGQNEATRNLGKLKFALLTPESNPASTVPIPVHSKCIRGQPPAWLVRSAIYHLPLPAKSNDPPSPRDALQLSTGICSRSNYVNLRAKTLVPAANNRYFSSSRLRMVS